MPYQVIGRDSGADDMDYAVRDDLAAVVVTREPLRPFVVHSLLSISNKPAEAVGGSLEGSPAR